MASKSAYQASEKGAEIEEQLDDLEKLLERLRAMFEQYFLGMSKMPPSSLHTEAERRIRDLTQIQIKNTALRYRFATLGQKFGAYNTYWKRTLRLIEQGKYVRDLQRVKRQADRTGEAIPEEILAAMPKLMRERVARDRANAMTVAARQGKLDDPAATGQADPPRGNVHRLDAALVPEDVDIDDLFASLTREAEEVLDASPPIVQSKPPVFDPLDERPAPPVAPAPAAPDARKRTGPTTPPLRPPSAMRGGGSVPPPSRSAPSDTIPAPMPAMPPPTPTPADRPTGRTVAPPPAAAPPSRPATMAPPSRPATMAPPTAAPRPAVGRVGATTPPSGATAMRTPPPTTAPPRAAAPPAAPPPGMNDSDTRALYQKYLKARELCGESNDGVTYDKLVRTLRSQSSKIMTDGRVKGVEFGVVIKDNKVVLKARPKT